ncbi:hypothetical protein KIN20_015206 [Parelaphostrongylus tenuis]|uniref:Alpha/beta hydrolase fold-3 domain-containing protein n=1 Tax=Parelaphostrongylus tenuis TaxID=148309 RepID=A0AAD5MX00_PARTN|nr:hypothetical protein KIN20_015206 [Parelaphostrongylus tenuis]
MDPDPALTHLYSCSRWAGIDPAEVINEYIRIGEKTCEELRLITHIEDLTYEDNDGMGNNTSNMVDVWGEVKEHLVIFLHGGYWQEGSRKLVSPVAVNLIKNGIAMASVGYEFASNTRPLSTVARQVEKAVEFLLMKYPSVTYVTLAGHSAGAQLVFKAYTHLKSRRIQKLALLAGVFDLQELPQCEIGTVIGLTREEAKLNSCSAFELVDTGVKVLLLIAIKDSPKLIEQNKDMAKAMKKAGVSVQYHEIKECDHFSLIHGFLNNEAEQVRTLLSFLCS